MQNIFFILLKFLNHILYTLGEGAQEVKAPSELYTTNFTIKSLLLTISFL